MLDGWFIKNFCFAFDAFGIDINLKNLSIRTADFQIKLEKEIKSYNPRRIAKLAKQVWLLIFAHLAHCATFNFRLEREQFITDRHSPPRIGESHRDTTDYCSINRRIYVDFSRPASYRILFVSWNGSRKSFSNGTQAAEECDRADTSNKSGAPEPC